jgi:hypothetical protein
MGEDDMDGQRGWGKRWRASEGVEGEWRGGRRREGQPARSHPLPNGSGLVLRRFQAGSRDGSCLGPGGPVSLSPVIYIYIYVFLSLSHNIYIYEYIYLSLTWATSGERQLHFEIGGRTCQPQHRERIG